MKRGISLVVLSAYAAAALHLLAASHALADSGAVVEAQTECAQGGHGSAGISHGHELQREERECGAVALVRTAGRTLAAVVAFEVVAQPSTIVFVVEHPASPLSVLSVAPKASPPV